MMHILNPASLSFVFQMLFGLEPGGDQSIKTNKGMDPTLVQASLQVQWKVAEVNPF